MGEGREGRRHPAGVRRSLVLATRHDFSAAIFLPIAFSISMNRYQERRR